MPAESKNVIRVLLVNDHPVVRAGLTSMSERYPDLEVVAGVSDGTHALALLKEETVDVLFL